MKLPAYGRDLLNQRLADRHPARVWIIYGDDWGRRPVGVPSLCVGTDWMPGTIDWYPIAGVPAHVVYREGPHVEELAGEIAGLAAPVILHYQTHEFSAGLVRAQEDVSDVAWGLRRPIEGGFAWPAWWSDEQDADYAARRSAYLQAVIAEAAEGQAA